MAFTRFRTYNTVLHDSQEHELLSSVPPDLAPSSDDGGVLPTTTSSGAAITTAGDDDDNDKRSNSHTQRYQAAAQLLTNPAEELDAQEAVKISLERITCTTTVCEGSKLPLPVWKDGIITVDYCSSCICIYFHGYISHFFGRLWEGLFILNALFLS